MTTETNQLANAIGGAICWFVFAGYQIAFTFGAWTPERGHTALVFAVLALGADIRRGVEG